MKNHGCDKIFKILNGELFGSIFHSFFFRNEKIQLKKFEADNLIAEYVRTQFKLNFLTVDCVCLTDNSPNDSKDLNQPFIYHQKFNKLCLTCKIIQRIFLLSYAFFYLKQELLNCRMFMKTYTK